MAHLRDMTAESVDFRLIASEWHGGQASALYAYASSGSIVPGLCNEIRGGMRDVQAHPEWYDNPFAEAFRLGRLLGHVAPMEDGEADVDDD